MKGHMMRNAYILAVIFLVLSCTRISIEEKEAPDFSLERLGGGKISLSELQGKPVMLYWFAGW